MNKTQNHGLDKSEWNILGVVFLLVGLTIWHIVDEMTVVAAQPLGTLGAPGGAVWVSGQGIETPTAYYPLRGNVALDKGVALVLFTSKGGARFICDDQRKVCVSTSRVGQHMGREEP